MVCVWCAVAGLHHLVPAAATLALLPPHPPSHLAYDARPYIVGALGHGYM